MPDLRSLLGRDRPRDTVRLTVPGGVVEVVFEALPSPAYEALTTAHTKPDGDLDSAPFLAALVAASAVDDALSEQEWAQVLEHDLSHGEVNLLRTRLFLLNDGLPAASAGKG